MKDILLFLATAPFLTVHIMFQLTTARPFMYVDIYLFYMLCVIYYLFFSKNTSSL